MAKATPDDVLDKLPEEFALADTIYVCSDQPANYAGIAAVTLASGSVTPGDGNGDFTIGAAASGRKVAVAEQADLAITGDGDATHVVLADAGNTRLLQVTTCTSQTLTSGGTVTVGTYDLSVGDPT